MTKILLWMLAPLDRWLWRFMVRTGGVLQCVDSPDTSGMNQAAADSAQLGRDAFAWFTAEAARTQGQRDASTQLQQDVGKAQLEAMNTQTALGKEYADYNRETFRPLEKSIVEEAQNFDTPGRQQAAADAATADVRAATGRAVESSGRTMARMGYTPTINATKMAQSAALAEAAAATGARRNVEATGRAMRMDAASLGRGLPSAQATAISTGTNAGGAAVGAAGAANSTAASAAGLMGQGFGLGMQGAGQAGSLYGQSANLGMQADMANSKTLGALAGGAFGMYSDESMKDGTGKPLSGRSARMAIENMPVDEGWTYKAGSPADDGGQPHNGPMRSDVVKQMGAEAAPGPHTIDPVTVQGNLIAAVGDISKEVKKLSARMGIDARSSRNKPPRTLARMGV